MDVHQRVFRRIRLFDTSCFLVLICLCNTTTAVPRTSTLKTTTACYGPDAMCSTFSMECHGAQRIEVVSLQYGTKRSSPECIFGISNCQEKHNVTKCCTYSSTDIFTEFSAFNRSSVFQLCQGKSACHGQAPRLSVSPYSSYVRMQYACVEDERLVNMCTESSAIGSDLFLTFNHGHLLPTINDAQECYCRIRADGCNTTLQTTFVNLEFNRPGDADSAGCSSATLIDSSLPTPFSCSQKFIKTAYFEHLNGDKVLSLRNIYSNDPEDRPNLLLVHFSVADDETIHLECLLPGVETKPTFSCVSTSSSTGGPSSTTKSTSLSSSLPSTLPSSTLFPSSSSSSSPSSSSTRSPSSSPAPASSSSSSSATSTTSITTTRLSTTVIKSISDSSNRASEPTTPFTLVSTSIPASSNFTSPPIANPVSVPDSLNPSSSTSASSSAFTTSRKPSSPPTRHSTTGNTKGSSVPTISATSKPGQDTTVSRLSSTEEHNIGAETVVTTMRTPSSVTGSSFRSVTNASRSSTLMTYLISLSSRTSSINITSSLTVTTEMDSNTITTSPTLNASTSGVPTIAVPTERPDDGDGANNSGLLIGVTVGAVLVVLLLAAIIMMCLCIRIKRKENVRKNYIRNTNIFYSFPEDADTGSMRSEPVDAHRGDWYTSSVMTQGVLAENGGYPSPTPLVCYNNNYCHEPEANKTPIPTSRELHSPLTSRMSDGTYSSDTSNDTIDFYNATEPCVDHLQDDSPVPNGKAVTFDPQTLYAQVVKEGRTPF